MVIIILAFPVGFWKPLFKQENSDQCLRPQLFHPSFLISSCGLLLHIYVYSSYEKLKNHKSPGVDQIPAELIKEGGRTIRYQIHKLIVSIWNKEELP